MRILLFILFLSCGMEPEVGSSFLASEESNSPLETENEFDAFMVVVQARCIQCHYEGSIVGRNFQNYKTPEDWVESGDVAPGRLDLSPIFYFIRGAGIYPDIETVPSLNPDLTPEEIETIRTFILEYDFE